MSTEETSPYFKVFNFQNRQYETLPLARCPGGLQLMELAQDVFNEIGSGHSESVYQRALAVEMSKRKIEHDLEVVVPFYYRGRYVGSGRMDMVMYAGADPEFAVPLIIEFKAMVSVPKDPEFEQVVKYLKAAQHIEYGVIVNFPQSGRKGGRKAVDVIPIKLK